jgi:hypothetical protein
VNFNTGVTGTSQTDPDQVRILAAVVPAPGTLVLACRASCTSLGAWLWKRKRSSNSGGS